MYKTSEIVRYYRKPFPEKGDVVIVRVSDKNEYGYNVDLLEYKNMKGFVTLSELSRKMVHRKKNIIDQEEIMPMSVLNTNKEKGTIDLSKKFLKDTDVDPIMEEFRYKHSIHRIGIEIHKLFCNYTKDQWDIEDVFSNTIWEIYDKHSELSHQDIFNNVIANPRSLFASDGCNEFFGGTFIDGMSKNIVSRITKKDCALDMEVKVLILDERGIDSLKEIFDLNGEVGKNKLTISFPSPPVYNLLLEGDDEDELRATLSKLKDLIRQRTIERGGLFSIHADIKIVKESKVDIKYISDFDLDRISV
jgi:translation initiation factor 2 subunit 1